MIYYAENHFDGAIKLIQKYNLRVVLSKEFVSEDELSKHVVFPDHDKLLHALQSHKQIYAYVMPDLKIYFHPDAVLSIVGGAYEEYFKNLLA